MVYTTKTTRPIANKVESNSALTLSIVIVNYNVKEFLEQTLISVGKALKGINAEIIVVDNASIDGSVELVREKFSHVKIITNPTNAGFARASNQGLEIATGDYLLLLNPDTIIQEDTFRKSIAFFEQYPATGLLGCKILNPDGTLQLACRRSFPTPWVAFTKLSGLSFLFSKSKIFGKYNLTYLSPDETYEVEAVSGSFMMARRRTLEQVGMLDESFFMYGEDLDWCYRIAQSGWKVIYYPGTQIIHFKGESSKKAKFDNLRIFYQAMELFAEKHFKQKYLLMPYWILWIAIWIRGAFSFLWNFIKTLTVPFADMTLLMFSLLSGVYLRFGNFENSLAFFPVTVAYTFVWMSILKLSGCYDKNKFSSSKAGMAIIAGFLINTSLTFFLKQYAFSRAVVLYSSLISFLLIPGWRLFIKFLSRSGLMPFKGTLGKTLLARNTLVVGDIKSCEKLIQKLNNQVDSGYNICGLISTNKAHIDEIVSGTRVLGGLDSLSSAIKQKNIHEVIFSTHELSYDDVLTIIANSGNQRVNFKLIPSNLEVIIGKASIDRIDDVPLLEIDYRLHQKRYLFIKRSSDIVFSVIILALTFPLFFIKKYLLSQKLVTEAYTGIDKSFFLRKFTGSNSIVNKIPYIWAILKGDLSFVGSELVKLNDPDKNNVRLSVKLKPGLTGLPQVNMNKQLTIEDVQKYHIYYLKNYSPLLDIEIIFKTLFKI